MGKKRKKNSTIGTALVLFLFMLVLAVMGFAVATAEALEMQCMDKPARMLVVRDVTHDFGKTIAIVPDIPEGEYDDSHYYDDAYYYDDSYYYDDVYYYDEPVYYEPSYSGYSGGTDLQTDGVVYGDDGTRYTWYSQNVLPGGGLDIPGRSVSEEGYVVDGDGNIAVASSDYAYGTELETPWGDAVVYDTGCASGTVDVYTAW